MRGRISVALERPGPTDVFLYFERSLEALDALGDSLKAFAVVREESKFYGLTLKERQAALRDMRAELDAEVSLALMASFEAALRVDFLAGVYGRKREAVSRDFRSLHSRLREKVRLEDILDAWKRRHGLVRKVGDFKELLPLRAWLAHGRYWTRKDARRADPGSVWQRGRDLINSLPGFTGPI